MRDTRRESNQYQKVVPHEATSRKRPADRKEQLRTYKLCMVCVAVSSLHGRDWHVGTGRLRVWAPLGCRVLTCSPVLRSTPSISKYNYTYGINPFPTLSTLRVDRIWRGAALALRGPGDRSCGSPDLVVMSRSKPMPVFPTARRSSPHLSTPPPPPSADVN
jgi:hypothetical protein